MEQAQMVHTSYADVLRHIDLSIWAEQMFCTVTTQMNFLRQFKDQPELKSLHKENYETSYHRNTAAGNLLRLVAGELDEMLILMTVECFIESRNHDKAAQTALHSISVPTQEDEQWITLSEKWHRRRKRHLKYAAEILRTMIGQELWAKGALLAE